MRALLLMCWLPVAALAQAPVGGGPSPQIRGNLGVTAPMVPNTAWLREQVASVRFLEGDTVGPSFRRGEQVTVLYRDPELGRVRVMAADRYGWVPAESLSPIDPSRIPGDIDLDALLKSLNPSPSTAP